MSDPLDDLLGEQKAYYDACAPEYLEDAGMVGLPPETQGDAARQIEAGIAAAGPLGDTLELACGPGTFTGLLAERAQSLTAVDGSSAMLSLAAARTGPAAAIEWHQRDLFAWTPERTYDFVFFSFWLSHVPPERFAAFWTKLAGALNPEGRVMFVDDGHRTEEELVAGPDSYEIERRLHDGRRYRIVKVPLTPAELERDLAALGWAIEVRPLPGPFFLGQGRLRP